MIRLLLVMCCILPLLFSPAQATVRPPADWMQSTANRQRWQEIWPELQEMQFGVCAPQAGPGVTRSSDFLAFLGKSLSGTGDDSDAGKRLDLNLDGIVNHFDLLELGYEVPRRTRTTSLAPPEGTVKWCVVRADFSDQPAEYGKYTAGFFSDQFFAENHTPPSANDYYQQVSYGKLAIDGMVATGGTGGDGWFRAQETRSYYDANHINAKQLVYEMVMASDAEIDFSQFDLDKDGYVDSFVVYYAGPILWGNGLHPHHWTGVNAHVDGVIVDSYFLTSYDGDDSHVMSIACHEFGHQLGLPDLYDIDYTSNGMARWSLMSDNEDPDQLLPSPDPWCKQQLGWVTPTVISGNVDDYPLNSYEDHPEVLKVWTNGQPGKEYFLIANIQRILNDATRPGDGLLILHCDDSMKTNADEYRKWVDVESARGLDDPGSSTPRDPLDNFSNGKPNDLYFAGNTDPKYTGEFSSSSNPTSNDYPAPGGQTFVRISDISASGAVMTLDIELSTPDAPQVQITSHNDNDNVSGSITVTADASASAGRSIDHVDFSLNGAYCGTDSSWPYELDFKTTGIYNGTRELRVVAFDNLGDAGADAVNLIVTNTAQPFPWYDGFEAGLASWASYNLGGVEQWSIRNVAKSGTYSAGCGSETDGLSLNEHDLLVSPLIDISGSTKPIARWYQRHRVISGENVCRLLVTTDEGQSFDYLNSVSGVGENWYVASSELSGYIGQPLRLAFRLDTSSGYGVESGLAGFWVDDLFLKEASAPPSVLSITPGNGSTLTGITTITVVASDDEGIDSVDFVVDGKYIGTDFSTPYSMDWNSDHVFDKTLPFTAYVTDTDGQHTGETISWNTSNPGLPPPLIEDWEDQWEPYYQIIDSNVGGYWHSRAGEGWNGSTAMFFGEEGKDYGSVQSDELISPTILLDGVYTPGLGMLHHYDIQDGMDFAEMYLTSDYDSWYLLASFTGNGQDAWRADGALLDSWLGQKVKLSWYFFSDETVNGNGWWLDNIVVQEAPYIIEVSPWVLMDGMEFTVTGLDFGEDLPEHFNRVEIDGNEAQVSFWSPTEIHATVPDGCGGGELVVFSHGIPSYGYPVIVILPAPALTDIGLLSE